MTEPMTEPQTIVVGLDGSAHSWHALRWAVDRAARTGARVRAVHAWQVPNAPYGPGPFVAMSPPVDDLERDARDALDAELRSVVTEFDEVDIDGVVTAGATAEVLLDEARHADLLVVGQRGRGGFTGLLLGSAADQVVRHAHCPVVVVPHDGS